MRFRITEPTFFWGKDRVVGEIMEAPTGPYRNFATGGGLQRIPQFVEMPEEIKQVLQSAAQAAVPAQAQVQNTQMPPSASFGEATAAILKPTIAPKPISRTAALLTSLASRRRKLEETIAQQAEAYAEKLGEVEASVPTVFAKAQNSLDDRQASLGEIGDSLVDFAGSNSDPLQRSS